ncbi:hypothetical protein LINPERPRIM_LOCUS26088 [Linum perenne]
MIGQLLFRNPHSPPQKSLSFPNSKFCRNLLLSQFSLAFFSSSTHLTTIITIFMLNQGMLNLKLHYKRRKKKQKKRRRIYLTSQEDSYKYDQINKEVIKETLAYEDVFIILLCTLFRIDYN